MTIDVSPQYSTRQRATALVYGLVGHALFAAAVLSMAVGLYTGMKLGRGRLSGWTAFAGNSLLVVQFPLIHSMLLRERGRRWLMRLAPLQLGRALSTTIFAGISSLQLIACFLAWSPVGRTLSHPPFAVKAIMTGGYGVSWILLFQSMREAGLSLQSGSLGWRSVWNNRKIVYPPLPTGPLHRRIRQPIYASFAMILWFAPSFTWEKMALAITWTVYCVVGSRMKEGRFTRLYGDAFRAYQQRVPFWIPKFRWPRKRSGDMKLINRT